MKYGEFFYIGLLTIREKKIHDFVGKMDDVISIICYADVALQMTSSLDFAMMTWR